MNKITRIINICILVAITTGLSACFHDEDNGEDIIEEVISKEYSGDTAKSEKVRDQKPQITTADFESQVNNNTDFALTLFTQLSDTESLQDKNIVFSPFSISLTVAMLSAGATNNTLAEINQTLHFSSDQDSLHKTFNSLDLAYESHNGDFKREDNSTGAIELAISNSLWAQKNYSFESLFLDKLAINYGAGVNLLDFIADPEAARVNINDWVKNQTKNIITDAMPANSINNDTRLVLTNTVYFKGDWFKPFSSIATENFDFTRLDSSTVNTPFMNTSNTFNYSQTSELTAVELTFVGEKLAMLILMPQTGTFNTYVANIDATKLQSVVNGLQQSHIALSLPKFDFKFNLPLKESLNTLGMIDAFTDDADFSGIDGTTDLLVQSAVHKAFISIDEAGAEAGAFTGISVGIESVPAPVIINQPFLFMIQDLETKSILFFGRVLDPSV